MPSRPGVPTWAGRPIGAFRPPSTHGLFVQRVLWVFAFACVMRAGAPSFACAQELTSFAAISMKEVMEEIGRNLLHGHSEVRLQCNVGGLEGLQKQNQGGAPIDVVVSAADRQMDDLEGKGLAERR